jgi:uncharacterized membrane protein YkgB
MMNVPSGSATVSEVEMLPRIERRDAILSLYGRLASLDRIGMALLRLGLVVVLVWIGGLKFADYEADSIVPLVANSPLMSFMYHHPAPVYRAYMNKEGELVPAHRAWQESNGTYTFSHVLGAVIVGLGLLIATHWRFPQFAAFGSALLVLMCCTTLSFLVTTPEAWVPALGDSVHGFPYLSGVGRLIIKDSIMFGAAVTTMADSARSYLARIGSPGLDE